MSILLEEYGAVIFFIVYFGIVMAFFYDVLIQAADGSLSAGGTFTI